ncbi:magnesium transporter MgtE N-terminal domain-containing protein [Evansella sp. AB-rgal1]|uniref:MotE family protein n=1 Tax=Evansella sp. AB-rgal1 TaxID=3242696 RepID=UPI00359D74D2
MNKEEQQHSKWQWFLMVIFIPAIFAMILAVVLLNYMGVNVGSGIQQVMTFLPFHSEEEDSFESVLQDQIVTLEEENKVQQTTISQLESDVSRKESKIDQLQNELQALLEEMDILKVENDSKKVEMKDIVRTFEAMTASKAANIISELEAEEAARLLSAMNIEGRSQIISRMPPADAAEIISLITE